MNSIHSAVEQGRTSTVKSILRTNPSAASLIESSENKDLPLHIAAANNRLTIAGILVSAGADVNAAGDLGRRPLHYAAKNNSDRMLRFLMKEGADARIVDENGFTAAFTAARAFGAQARNSVRILSAEGENLDINTAICIADLDRVSKLLDDGREVVASAAFPRDLIYDAVVALSSELMTDGAFWAINQSVESKSLARWMPVLSKLVELGAPVDERGLQSWPALFEAVKLPVTEIARFLLENGADPNYRSEVGTSAWQLAESSLRCERMRSLLVSKGFTI